MRAIKDAAYVALLIVGAALLFVFTMGVCRLLMSL